MEMYVILLNDDHKRDTDRPVTDASQTLSLQAWRWQKALLEEIMLGMSLFIAYGSLRVMCEYI